MKSATRDEILSTAQRLNSSTFGLGPLAPGSIRREGPISFAHFMEEALYHPEHGYYSSGRCAIGRRGDYFTSVSVGPLFGRLMAAQFAEIWEKLERPDDFVIVEQGAHHGEFATDVLEALRETTAGFFSRPSAIGLWSRSRFCGNARRPCFAVFLAKTEWCASLEEMEPFCGVNFSNELLDALPVHLLVRGRRPMARTPRRADLGRIRFHGKAGHEPAFASAAGENFSRCQTNITRPRSTSPRSTG